MAGLALGAGVLAVAPQAVLAHGKDKLVQNVTVTVDGSGYHPAALNLKAGKPVHLTFVSKGGGCANAISIPALKKTLSLKPGQKKEVVFTPKKGQIIGFACSMKMYKGKVVAK
jgi:plastocyanin domain-containing protein